MIRPPSRLRNSPVVEGSPSVALEKGGSRMRAPHLGRYRASTPDSQPEPRARSQTQSREREHYLRQNTVIAVLIVLLAFCCIASFAAAYYLFSSRWEYRHFLPPPPSANSLQPEAIDIDTIQETILDGRDHGLDEKYLSYLPHSGFHNQRIALENAIVLSFLLNRTLIMPPIRLGNRPIRYLKHDTLTTHLALSDKEGLLHCANLSPTTTLPLECLDYYDYTHIDWEWLVDLRPAMSPAKILHRSNMTNSWIIDTLRIARRETFVLRDNQPYQFRFLDTLSDASPSTDRYSQDIYIDNLALRTERLLRIGTLFGSSRLRLKDPANKELRKKVRRQMAFANLFLLRAAESINNTLGGKYYGAHVRLGDGRFRAHAEENSRVIWRRLVSTVLPKQSAGNLTILEELFWANVSSPPSVVLHPNNTDPSHSPAFCRAPLHDDRTHPFNTPLFLSTDVLEPYSNSLLSGFFRAFPCTFVLEDFSKETAELDRLRNARDGVMLKSFLVPFLDAIVVGKAAVAVGTDGSTFSTFILDVLWRTYHGMDIRSRG
ncbi:hypothetical protein FISHEDRAFT_71983 [Fistulina hepatica ATCC 64428]|uniref:CigA protein n=1 Tax=Fistulina hepatica ATCC 64428 TaxID=1128425 RepID=A0A0D7AJ81_9AGAR|nr:hypothetical protein FISHEDRAFT_71983 [Fistulina hepatica ATCC 64428]